MRYLIDGITQPLGDVCIGKYTCKCNRESTYTSICGLRYDQDQSCPKHCWVQVCTTAKVDPFNVDV